MSQFDNPLAHVRVAAPCPADWSRMRGDERVRFCGQCSLNVYNLSAMSKVEAETLIMQAEGRLCVRYYRRSDGTILTNSCPVGLRAFKQRVTKIGSGVFASLVSFFAGIGALTGWQRVGNWFEQRSQIVMGSMVRTTDFQISSPDPSAIKPEPQGVWNTGMIPVIPQKPLKSKKHKKSRPKSKAVPSKNFQRVVERNGRGQ